MSRLLIILLLFVSAYTYAQRPIFSQYYSTGLYLNPSLAGLEKDPIFQSNYRSQWEGADLPFTTMQASFIHPIMKPGSRTKHIGGIGASFFSDRSGLNDEFEVIGANIAYAQNLHLNNYGNNIITIGGMIGAYQNILRAGAFQWSTQYDPSIGFDPSMSSDFGDMDQRVFYPVMNMGMMWSYRNKQRYALKEFGMFTGVAVESLNQPNVSFFDNTVSDLSPLTKLHGGFSIFLTKKFSLSPNYLIQYQNGNFQTNTGAYFGYMLSDVYNSRDRPTKLIFGTWYRLQDSFIFNFGVVSKNFNFAFSYDVNTSSFGRFANNAGAYEFSLAFKLVKKQIKRRFSSPLI